MKTKHIILAICGMALVGCNKNDDSVSPETELQNEPPLSFNLVDVPDGATDVDLLPTLSWESAKNPKGGEVTYDLYLGKEMNPTNLYQSGISGTSFQIEERLNLISDHYWKVVAKDVNEQSSKSDIQKFTTRNLAMPEEPLIPEAEFKPRTGHTSVVFNNKLWVIGGYSNEALRMNDVWYSADGANWTSANLSAAFSKRLGHASVVFDDKLWVIGGLTEEGYKNDIWYSSDGINWEMATSEAGFSKRNNHEIAVLDGKLWVVGGYGGSTDGLKNDVWYSDDGTTWMEATPAAAFSKRSGHALEVFNDKLWLIGGYDDERKNDVWFSDDGANWSMATSAAAFSGRASHAVTKYDNKLWLIGGREINNKLKNDIWYSLDGMVWKEATASATFSHRASHTVEVFKNKLLVIAGGYASGERNDVWAFD